MFVGCMALLLLLLAWLVTPFEFHKINTSERAHLEDAVRFLREQKAVTGKFPGNAEFQQWARAMDARGAHNYEGYVYQLLRQCNLSAEGFCINFWTGEAFVTYQSSQENMSNVRVDDRLPQSVLVLLIAGLGAGLASGLLLAFEYGCTPRERG